MLTASADFLFGGTGQIILAIIVLLACLSTSIGLITSCSTYFHKLYSKISYKMYVVIFSVAAFALGLFGLKTIISAAIPVLMLLYPLTIVIILSALMSGLETAGWAPDAIEGLFTQYIPFQGIGMGWVSFAILGFIIGLIHKGLVSDTTK